MTENEAIKELDDYVAEEHKQTISFEAINMARKALVEIQAYRAIGTVEDFMALKEKAEPKKPITHALRENKVMCPHCTNWLEAHSSKVFCCYCGKKIDWE